MNNDIYLALDFPTWTRAEAFLTHHDLGAIPVKVGMELFYREGAFVIQELKKAGHKLFLDLKLHDIPNTVKQAMANLAKLEIDMTTIHASGGRSMMAAAKEGLLEGGGINTTLLAVTMLTSIDQKTMNEELGITGDVQTSVRRLALQAQNSGVNGVVCSVHEAQLVKEQCKETFQTVTPGIRLQNASNDDQQRVATPQFARQNGSDCIVVGRSVTAAKDPKQAYQMIREAWDNGLR